MVTCSFCGMERPVVLGPIQGDRPVAICHPCIAVAIVEIFNVDHTLRKPAR